MDTSLHGSERALTFRAQELCERRGGRPELPVRTIPYDLGGRKATLKKKKSWQ